MSTLAEVRNAIKDTLQDPAIPGLTVYAKPVSAPNYPCVMVHPRDADFTVAFQRGLITWDINLYVLVGALNSNVSQDLLDELLNPSGGRSIPEAIYNNRKLGLDDTDAVVTGMEGYWNKFLEAHIGAVLILRVNTVGT